VAGHADHVNEAVTTPPCAQPGLGREVEAESGRSHPGVVGSLLGGGAVSEPASPSSQYAPPYARAQRLSVQY